MLLSVYNLMEAGGGAVKVCILLTYYYTTQATTRRKKNPLGTFYLLHIWNMGRLFTRYNAESYCFGPCLFCLLWVRNPIEINKVGSFTLEHFLFHFMFAVKTLENEKYPLIGNSRENEACQNWRKNVFRELIFRTLIDRKIS